MIKIQRTVEPQYLSSRKSSWLKELREAKRKKDLAKYKILQGRYGHEKIKIALNSMCNGKCAYCESTIEVVTAPHIEHFRPKQRFVSLTYEWSNLLIACPKCNDKTHKGTKFPNKLQGGLLVNPSTEDPSNHFDFIYDPITKLATIKPITGRGSTTAQIFGLNTRVALIKTRSDLVRQLLALKQFDGSNPEVTEVLKQARQSSSPYLAWVQKYI